MLPHPNLKLDRLPYVLFTIKYICEPVDAAAKKESQQMPLICSLSLGICKLGLFCYQLGLVLLRCIPIPIPA